MDENNSALDGGTIKISDEVVSIIAGIAAFEVPGVSAAGSGIGEIFGTKKNPTRGVKVEVLENDAQIDLQVMVNYGIRIPEVAWEVQERVKKSVESMTGLTVSRVNIHITGISIEKTKKEAEPEAAPEEE